MRLLPVLLLLIVMVVLLLPLLSQARLAAPRARRRRAPDELVKDPVCQTYIVKSRAIQRAGAGQVRYFCSERCARLDTGA